MQLPENVKPGIYRTKLEKHYLKLYNGIVMFASKIDQISHRTDLSTIYGDLDQSINECKLSVEKIAYYTSKIELEIKNAPKKPN